MGRRVVVGLGVLLILCIHCLGRTITVALDGAGDFSTIQAGIDAAEDGDVVVVSDGLYTGVGNRDIEFKGKAITVRSANGPEACVIDCEATSNAGPRGFYLHSGEGSDSVIQGFTIQGAGAPAVYCEGAVPVIRECILRKNPGGAAISILGGSGWLVEKCVVEENVYQYGSAVEFRDTVGVMKNCIIRNNVGRHPIGCPNCSIEIRHCRIAFNRGRYCGGIFCAGSTNAILADCALTGNTGGDDTWPGSGAVTVPNGGTCSIRRSTLVGNCAGNGALLEADHESTIVLTGSIVYDNTDLTGGTAKIRLQRGSTLTATYSLIEKGQESVAFGSTEVVDWGEGNIDEDPLLARDGMHLLAGSPCIDAGDPTGGDYSGRLDLDGRARQLYGGIDMGAFEFSRYPDLQADGVANLQDLGVFASAWVRDDCDAANAWCARLDLAADGSVGVDDLSALAEGWLSEYEDASITIYLAFDESGGDTAFDSSGRSRDGTLTSMGESAWVEGMIGGAIAFDGTDAYVTVAGWKGIGGARPRTCCAWVKTAHTGGVIVAWGPLGVPGGRWVFGTEGQGRLQLAVGGGLIAGSTPVCDGQWHHVAAVSEGGCTPNVGQVRLYVDGELDVPSAAGNRAIDTAVDLAESPDVAIGFWPPGGAYFEGVIDEMRIYERALRAEEVAALAAK